MFNIENPFGRTDASPSLDLFLASGTLVTGTQGVVTPFGDTLVAPMVTGFESTVELAVEAPRTSVDVDFAAP